MLNKQRELFQIPADFSYLNCATMSPLSEKVVQAGLAGFQKRRMPFQMSSADFFEEVETLKEKFAGMIHCRDHQRIALMPSVSYGIANAAKNIKIRKGQHILMVDEIFPSNYYSWERLSQEKEAPLHIIKPEGTKDRGKNWNQRILDAIDENTAVITLGNIHWADGTLFDLQAIREKTRAVGAAMIIDASQSLGALPIDVESLQPDALVAVSYKWLFGPYGNAMAYYGPYFDQGIPIEENWINRKNSQDFKNLVDYQSDYQPAAGRYSVGQQSNFSHIPMIIAALDQVSEWGVEHIQEYTRQLTRPYIEQLREMGLHIEDEAWRSSHLLGVRFSEGRYEPTALKKAFQEKKVIISLRGSAVRISTHLFNVAEDWEKVVEVFKTT